MQWLEYLFRIILQVELILMHIIFKFKFLKFFIGVKYNNFRYSYELIDQYDPS
jgi:hypothetical protein